MVLFYHVADQLVPYNTSVRGITRPVLTLGLLTVRVTYLKS
jgi:hypothetical protein